MITRLLILPCLLLTPVVRAQEEAPAEPQRSYVDVLRDAGIEITSGPATVPLGDVAEIQLPADHHAIGRNSIKTYYDLTQNTYSGNEVGVVIGPGNWMLYFDFNDTGYVKDDEKDKLDADELMKALRESQTAANEARAQQGWPQFRLNGWVQEPFYDPDTHNLKWALTLSSSEDNHQQQWVNESIRLLGRSGVMNVTLVTEPASFAADAKTADALLASNFNYVAGQRYAEFKPGDKVAEYGLTALVLGGAGALAYKVGFLQKFWKVLVGGFVALVAVIKRFFKRNAGKEVT